jgi:membrane protein
MKIKNDLKDNTAREKRVGSPTFFNEGIWDIQEDPAKPIKSFFIRSLKIAISSGLGFIKDECFLKSSALTYYSLLSIVPFLAVAFGIAIKFGFEKSLESAISEIFYDILTLLFHIVIQMIHYPD